MAATDLTIVQKQAFDQVNGVTTNGTEERVTLAEFVTLLPPAGAAVAGSVVMVTRQTAPAVAPVPFADLTAAANAYNTLRTALINAGVLV